MIRPTKKWRYSKRALVLHALAWCVGVSNHVITRVALGPLEREVEDCIREPGHDGPCNGWAVPSCPGYAAMMAGRAENDL